MIVIHNQLKPPLLRAPHRQGDIKRYPVSWDDRVSSGRTIVESVYTMPEGFTVVESLRGVAATVDGQAFNKTNIVVIEVPEGHESGIFLITNNIKTNTGQKLSKSFYIKVETPPQEL